MTTVELVARAQQGDHEAFETLAKGAYDRLYAIARRILRDDDLAKDAVQDALIRAWRDCRALRDGDRFDGWLYRLLVNACKNQLRSNRRHAMTVHVTDLNAPAGEDAFGRVADRDELEHMFAQLPLEHRAVLVLTHYLGMSAAEVSASLGIPVGTVYSRLHYGARQARSALNETGMQSAPTTGGSR